MRDFITRTDGTDLESARIGTWLSGNIALTWGVVAGIAYFVGEYASIEVSMVPPILLLVLANVLFLIHWVTGRMEVNDAE